MNLLRYAAGQRRLVLPALPLHDDQFGGAVRALPHAQQRAHPEPEELRTLFRRMGYAHVANHKTKAIELWQQGDITYLLNAEPGTHAAAFIEEHGAPIEFLEYA